MKLETFVYRINLFGIIWATIVNLTFALAGGFGSQLGQHAYDSFDVGFLSLISGEIGGFMLGVLVAVPFALALNIAELVASDKQRFAPWFVLKVAAPVHFCTFLWFVAFGPAYQFGPEGFLSGGLRVGIVGLIAAIAASYFISLYSPYKVYEDNRFLASAVLIVEFLMIAALLFPTFQKVRGNQLASATEQYQITTWAKKTT